MRTTVEGDEVRVRHDTLNPHDPNACVVETLTGEQLGFVPKELALRLALPHPGGRWRARIVEVFRRETWGLRLQLGPLTVEGVRERAGAQEPGFRHRDDGVAEGDGVVVATMPDPASAASALATDGSGAATALAQAAATRTPVYAKSGRQLGLLVERTEKHVTVLTAAGSRTVYPAAVVRVG